MWLKHGVVARRDNSCLEEQTFILFINIFRGGSHDYGLIDSGDMMLLHRLLSTMTQSISTLFLWWWLPNSARELPHRVSHRSISRGTCNYHTIKIVESCGQQAIPRSLLVVIRFASESLDSLPFCPSAVPRHRSFAPTEKSRVPSPESRVSISCEDLKLDR